MKNPQLEKLEERYYEAVNALSEYRKANGFIPGARVVARFMEGSPLNGVIAPYGPAWDCGHDGVPVPLDRGYIQPWKMSNLTLLKSPTERAG